MKDNEVNNENTNNNNLTADKEDITEVNAVKIHINDENIDTNCGGTIV